MIYLRNTGSDLFEEAFFVLKPGNVTENASEKDMVVEAKRILEADRSERGIAPSRYSNRFSRMWKIKFFFLGIACSAFAIGTVFLILWLI